MLFAGNIYCQSIVVKYDIELQFPKSVETQDGDVKNMLNLVYNRVKEYNGKLTISDQNAKFETVTSLSIGDDSSVDMAVTFSLNSNDLYFIQSDSLVRITEMLISPLKVKYKPDYPWEILQEESKKINNYICLRAICTFINIQGKEQEVEAYFAPNLPYPYGPVGFSGLPGLILELRVNNILYRMSDIIRLDDTTTIQVPPGEALSLTEFEKLLKKSEKMYSNSKG